MRDSNRGRGRPREDGAMRGDVHVRLDQDMMARLDRLTQMTGMSRADIFREAFDGYEKLKTFQLSSDDDTGDSYEYYDDFVD